MADESSPNVSARLVDWLQSVNLQSHYAYHDLLQAKRENRQIFVAYAYTLYPQDDYRRPFGELSKAFKVNSDLPMNV